MKYSLLAWMSTVPTPKRLYIIQNKAAQLIYTPPPGHCGCGVYHGKKVLHYHLRILRQVTRHADVQKRLLQLSIQDPQIG